ncbi:PLP-dependent aminotransferase family protein [Conexibacter woesei]|uniref:aminotransferase-like domain-containing protein n=1 Tax=Conexibacter woesei TaxID=191495 RepID=UPI00047C9D60|nr:PLP-dependent aminotransferase family protein [Conexibacter woesei]
MIDGNTESRVIEDVRTAARALPPGSRLPSVRELMARHRASPVTVQRALSRLAGEGLVVPRPGRGTFVAEKRATTEKAPDLGWQEVALADRPPLQAAPLDALLALPPDGAIPLTGGYLHPDLQPVAALGAALGRAARRPEPWGRLAVEGLQPLREWFAREAGGHVRGHDVVICSGGQPALATAFRALAAPGEPVLVESPTYLGAISALRSAGLRAVPVPTDADGVRPDLLAAAFALTGARVFYCQPLHANPTGATLAPHRRAAVLDAVRAAGAFLIEDDWARDLRIDGEAPPPLASDDPDGHVVYLRSLTKSAAPGLRIAAVSARGAAGARIKAARIIDDFFVSGPLQHATLELISAPAWRRHLKRLRAELRVRRDALTAALGEHLPDWQLQVVPAGGFHVWLRLPDDADDIALTARAAAAGVLVSPGRPWFAAEPPGPHVRLTFAGAPAPDLVEGVRRLAKVAAQ